MPATCAAFDHQVSPVGKLLVVGLLDGDLSIGDLNVSETEDEFVPFDCPHHSGFWHRVCQDFFLDFGSGAYSNVSQAKLDVHFLDDDRFMVTHTLGQSQFMMGMLPLLK